MSKYYTIGCYDKELNKKVKIGLVVKCIGGFAFDLIDSARATGDKLFSEYSIYELVGCKPTDIKLFENKNGVQYLGINKDVLISNLVQE